jgi:hypothetical protein
MKSFYCTMDGPGVQWVLSGINSTETLLEWCTVLQGSIYDGSGTPASSDAGGILERLLNSIVMVEGGNNYLTSTPETSVSGGGNTQGCLVSRASVPIEIVLLLGLVSILLVIMIADFFLLACRHKRATYQGQRVENVDVPNGLVSWMLRSAREAIRDGYRERFITQMDLKFWGFGRKQDGRFGVHRLGPLSIGEPDGMR